MPLETGFYSIVQALLELRSSCLSLPSARILEVTRALLSGGDIEMLMRQLGPLEQQPGEAIMATQKLTSLVLQVGRGCRGERWGG